jgi:hypothetical protein
MNRYEIAKKMPAPITKARKNCSLRKCELWKLDEQGTVQGAVCYLSSLEKFESTDRYRSPYSIKISAQVPGDFHLPLKGQILMKLDGEEYHLTILELKQNYGKSKSVIELSASLKLTGDNLTPIERRNLKEQKFALLSTFSKQQRLQEIK